MANEQNLISLADRTTEEQRAIARLGGKASGEARRAKKTIAQALREVLDEPLVSDPQKTKLEAIVGKTAEALYKKPSAKGLKILAEILGEMEVKVHHEGLALNIQTSEEGKANIEKIIEGE